LYFTHTKTHTHARTHAHTRRVKHLTCTLRKTYYTLEICYIQKLQKLQKLTLRKSLH